jgi:hypothetical protein
MELGMAQLVFGKHASINMDSIKHAENLDFHSAWTAEADGNGAVSTAAWILAQTSTIHVGTAIMQMPACSPAVAAITAMTLDPDKYADVIKPYLDEGFARAGRGSARCVGTTG